jgi:hypothetical protein
MTTNTNTNATADRPILAIDLGNYKRVAWVHPRYCMVPGILANSATAPQAHKWM